MNKKGLRLSKVTAILMLTVMTMPVFASTILISPLSYSPISKVNGVIEKDRFDFMTANGNPLQEDSANAVFQGPGVFDDGEGRTNTTGYMKDIYLEYTKYGTLSKMNYTGEGRPSDPLDYVDDADLPQDGNAWVGVGTQYQDKYHWLPVIEQTPVPMDPLAAVAPLEGWAIAYNVTFYPIRKDHGYVVLTGSGFQNQSGVAVLKPNVMGQEADDNWIVNVVDTSVWVDNPREKVVFYNISALNDLSATTNYNPLFELDQVLIFNKATKIVEIFMNLRLVSINFPPCTIVVFNMSLTRMAIFDANPYCDRAFYGWKNITIADGKTQDAFIVLSYTNTTLEHWVRTTEGYDYFADYMLTYPIPDNFALGSCWWDSTDNDTLVDAYNVWNASQLRFARVAHPDPLTPPPWPNHVPDEFCMDKYVVLVMGDITGDGLGDGDQALTRVEWYTDVAGDPEEVIGSSSGWKMVQYGVYDVNDTYDGGEGGLFDIGFLQLSTGQNFARPRDFYITGLTGLTPPFTLPPVWPDPWPHDPDTTLGWLDTFNDLYRGQTGDGFPDTGVKCTLKEDKLTKWVFYLDIDQDGRKDLDEEDDGDAIDWLDEYFLPYSWYPTEELWWQLRWKLGPTTLEKIPNCTCSLFEHSIINPENDPLGPWYEHECYDFTVVPAPGATTDAAGAAWLTARFTSWLVTFDVEAYNMIATASYANPGTKMLPYLMLRLASITGGVQDYGARKARYLTSDGRALPQMEFESIQYTVPNVNGTPWHNEHYLLVSVAGIHPNLATYYFNDFSPIIRPVGGDEVGSIVVLPYGGPYSFADLAADEGYGVISVVRDHFNNTALLVWGGDSQDTYWTAWYATWLWEAFSSTPGFGNNQSVLLVIDYSTTGKNWGIPLGDPDGFASGIPTAHPWYPLINGQPGFSPPGLLIAYATEYECRPPL